jgi:hypothetical protein
MTHPEITPTDARQFAQRNLYVDWTETRASQP